MNKILIGTGLFCLCSGLASESAAQLPEVPRAATEVVELGRLLFWDPILSGGQDVACATCHHPDFAYADGRALSLGPGAEGLGPDRIDHSNGLVPVMRRNSPTVLNTAFNGVTPRRRGRGGRGGPPGRLSLDQVSAPMFWDSRVQGLEAQALEPIKTFEEMRGSAYEEGAAIDSVTARLRAVPDYVLLFEEAFGRSPIDADMLGQALATFQRSLVATNSPFDRFQAGDTAALTAQQRRGMETFDDVGCDRCHNGPMFSDFRLHAEGVGENPLLAEPDTSRGRFRFRTPSLRNVELTAPYMHNGVLESLEDVLRFYDNGVSENPNVVAGRGRRGAGPGRRQGPGGAGQRGVATLDQDFRRVANMSDQQMDDIIAFLRALTDDDFDRAIPDRVPSGLAPGGLIHR